MKLKLIIYFFIFLIGAYPFAQASDIVVGQSPPYIDKNVINNGILTEIVEKSFKDQGFKYNLKFSTWSISKDSINNLSAISFAYLRGQKEEKNWLFSIPILLAPKILISHKENDLDIGELEDIKFYRIGITRGHNYGSEFEKLKPLLDLEAVNSDLMNMKKILHRRIDLFPIPLYTAIYYMRENFTDKEREKFEFILYPNLTKGDLHLVCHKSNEQCSKIIEIFNSGLDNITSSGIKDRIVSEFLSNY